MKLMKFLVLIAGYYGYAQNSDVLNFSYDSAGNQIIRELICVSCSTPSASKQAPGSQPLTKSREYSDISFYPNPVSESLFIKWQNDTASYVTSVEIYSVSGQKVYSQSNLEATDNISVAFQNMASGYYSVLLLYNTGSQKDLKVIKK